MKLVHFAEGFAGVGRSTILYDSNTIPTSSSWTVAFHRVGNVGCLDSAATAVNAMVTNNNVAITFIFDCLFGFFLLSYIYIYIYVNKLISIDCVMNILQYTSEILFCLFMYTEVYPEYLYIWVRLRGVKKSFIK